MKTTQSNPSTKTSRILSERIRPSHIESLEARIAPAGTWANLTAGGTVPPGENLQAMILLSDGTLMAQAGANTATKTWYGLHPNATGNYVNGSWTQLANMAEGRLFFTEALLPNGRMFLIGGEYGDIDDYSGTAEIYNPITNTFTLTSQIPTPLTQIGQNTAPAAPESQFGDGPIVVMPNGDVLAGYIFGTQTYRYTAGTDSWVQVGSKLHGDQSSEESWVKLADDSILSYDVFASGGGTFQAQRFIPSTNTWVDASNLNPMSPPSILENNGAQGRELGPAFLQPNGKVIFFGANGNNAIYDPANNWWEAGPASPQKALTVAADGSVTDGGPMTNLVMADAPGAMMANGHILVALSPQGFRPPMQGYNFPDRTYMYEYDPVAQTFTEREPGGPGTFLPDNAYRYNMAILPTGQVLLGAMGEEARVFTPTEAPNDAWRPVIKSVADDGGGTYTLHGLQLNGISEGAQYGDDWASASNYPLVRFTLGATVSYARTYNWSSTGVATGTTPVSTKFDLPAGHTDIADFDTVTVVANGIPSVASTIYHAGGGNESFTVRVKPGDATMIQVLDDANNLLDTLPNNTDNPLLFVGDAADNKLTIDETFGRLNVPVQYDGSGSGPGGDQFEVIGGSGPDTLNVKGTTGTGGDATFNGSKVYSFDGVEHLAFNGSAGDDTLTVDSSLSLLGVSGGTQFDGGGGQDRLNLVQTGGPARTGDIYRVGPENGQGSSSITDGVITQQVFFQNIEPVFDNVPAVSLTVNGSSASNAINYAKGPGGGIFVGNTGRVTTDDFESIEFNNKTSLVIDGQAGSDTINLHYDNSANPAGLTGTITANGSDPTASDTLVVNGLAGVLDNLRYLPTSAGAGTVVNDSEPQPNVLFTGIEHLDLVVQSADGDSIRTEGTTGNDTIDFFTGITADSGTFRGAMDANNATGSGPFQMTEMTFHGANSAANDEDVNFFNPGGTDFLRFNGTASDDLITVQSGQAGGTEFNLTHDGVLFARLEVFNVASGAVGALGGNDTINVLLPAGPAAVTLRIEGGDSDASSDILNFTGTGGGITTVDLAAGTIKDNIAALLTFTGVEKVNAVLGASALILTGSTGADIVTLTPAAGFTLDDYAPGLTLHTTNTGALTLNLAGADDSLTVNGTAGGDALTFIGTASDAGTVQLNALALVTFTGTERLVLRGNDGGDTFNLDGGLGSVNLLGGAGTDVVSFGTALTGVTFDMDAIGTPQRVTSTATVTLLDQLENFTGSTLVDVLRVTPASFARAVNGGTPSTAPGDILVVDAQGLSAAVMNADANTGTVKFTGFADVNFDEFEKVTILNSPGGGGFGAPGASNAFSAGVIYDTTQVVPLPGRPLVGNGPTAVAVGDVNGDGFVDMVSANSKSKFLSILLGKGDGTFGLATNILSGGTTPTDVALADMEADGDLDIVVTNAGSKTVALLLNNGLGVFAAPLLTPKLKLAPTALAVGDVDGDARPDVVVAHSNGAVSVFLGVPTGVGGALGPQAQVKTGGKGTTDVVLGDFTGDGLLDIATSNGGSGNVSLLANAGAGVFSIAPQLFKSGIRPTALAVADFNNDGKIDLAVSHAVSRFISVLIGNATPAASFQPALHVNYPGNHFPKAMAAGDFNGDGKIDLALGPTVAGKLRVILGDGQGDFSQPYDFDLGNKAARVVGGITLADVNLDGQLDILTANTSSNDLSVLLRHV